MTFGEFTTAVDAAYRSAIYAGITPSELLLGKEALEAFDREINSSPFSVADVTGQGQRVFNGLLVIPCQIPGVRVGISFPG
jgi:hypothetical protein